MNSPGFSSPFELVFLAWILSTFAMSLSWAWAIRYRFLSVVDAVWAFGIGMHALIFALLVHPNRVRAGFVVAFAAAWSLRLGLHLTRRLRAHFPVEDTRYQTLKRNWGSRLGFNSFLFFVFQGLLQAFFAYPFAAIVFRSEEFPVLNETLGFTLSGLALLGETLADRQLKLFKENPVNRGRVCNVGLWRYSRHPNYFFEWLIWCGFALAAFGAPLGWLALSSPIAMLLLLLFVTGVAPSEAQAILSKGNAYREYQKATSSFVPWFPKNLSSKGDSYVG